MRTTSHGVILKVSRAWWRVPEDIGAVAVRSLVAGAVLAAFYELIAR